MEERKRRRATAVAISKFREEHPSYSDEHIANLVEKTCPGIYDNDLETAVEVVKELYREQEDWTDENFARLLKEMTVLSLRQLRPIFFLRSFRSADMRRKYYCKITAVFLTLATLLYGCQSAETPASDAVVEDTAAPASETDDQEELQEEYMGSKGNQLPRLKELSENVVTADKDPAARKVFEELKRIGTL